MEISSVAYLIMWQRSEKNTSFFTIADGCMLQNFYFYLYLYFYKFSVQICFASASVPLYIYLQNQLLFIIIPSYYMRDKIADSDSDNETIINN